MAGTSDDAAGGDARTSSDASAAGDAARLLDQASGRRPEVRTKRTLVAVSHAIEQAVLAAPRADPTVVIALFQRSDYFERERAAYERIARAGVRVAVGFRDDLAHPLPAGVAAVPLGAGEPLAEEWSVVAVSPVTGAFLVGTDQHAVEPDASSWEAGRRFRCRWGFSRVQATVELARLRVLLGERLPAELVRTIDRLLGETMAGGADPAGSAGSPQEVWSTTAALHMAERLAAERSGGAVLRARLSDAHAVATARNAAGTDPQSGLATADVLRRWADGGAPSVLPVGIGLLDLPAVVDAGRGGTDPRAAHHAARRIAAALTQPLGPVDAAVRLSDREFAVALPGASERRLAEVCDEISEQLALASDGYPHVPLGGMLATVVTRNRPLPLERLRRALDAGDAAGEPGAGRAAPAAEGEESVTVRAVGAVGAVGGGGGLPAQTPASRPAPEPADPARSADGETAPTSRYGSASAGRNGAATTALPGLTDPTSPPGVADEMDLPGLADLADRTGPPGLPGLPGLSDLIGPPDPTGLIGAGTGGPAGESGDAEPTGSTELTTTAGLYMSGMARLGGPSPDAGPATARPDGADAAERPRRGGRRRADPGDGGRARHREPDRAGEPDGAGDAAGERDGSRPPAGSAVEEVRNMLGRRP